MNFEEHAAKRLLAAQGIATPPGRLADSPQQAERAAAEIGPCVVKAQAPIGKRGQAGGIQRAATPAEAKAHAENILGMQIGGHRIEKLLIEGQASIARELYAAVLSDPVTLGPVILFSTMGGMDVEAAAAQDPAALRRLPVDIAHGVDAAQAQTLLHGLDLGGQAATLAVAETLVRLYGAYRAYDAELLEINPLIVAADGGIVALDCKFTLDDSAQPRQPQIAKRGTPEKLTRLERAAAQHGLKYIELGGDVGVFANGAGLTMTTMDAIAHFGGSPANFLEIGGEAYTKAKPALQILLDNPNLRSVLVNFCGAFARTDVMAQGVASAWQELRPDIPIFFTIHGTGEDEAVALVKRELGVEPFERMDDAVRAAVDAARATRAARAPA